MLTVAAAIRLLELHSTVPIRPSIDKHYSNLPNPNRLPMPAPMPMRQANASDNAVSPIELPFHRHQV